MKLSFETWLDSHGKPQEAEVAFAEAVLCYKMGAYRAALLFSYVGWNLILRKRLLEASCPPGVAPGQWTQLLKELRKDEKWDDNTFDATQNAQTPYFPVSQQIREQVKYWKDRRNDCAHFKENEIIAAHVDAFWAFIRSNLPKFTPVGSSDALKTKFLNHFDPNLTAPGANIAALVGEIPSAVEPKDLPNFIDDLFASPPSTSILTGRSRYAPVLAAGLLVHGTKRVIAEGIRYLTANPKLIIEAARYAPMSLQAFAQNAQVLRSIWMSELFAQGRKDLVLFVSMLSQGLIPVANIPAAVSLVVPKLNDEIPDDASFTVLNGAGFFTKLAGHAFGSDNAVNSFGWGNRNSELVAWLLATFELQDEWVTCLCSVFISQPFPNSARDTIAAMFVANPAKRQDFIAASQRLGLTPPPELVGQLP